MVRRAILLGATGAFACSLAACDPPHPHAHAKSSLRTVSSLDCPDTQGDLTRTARADDGRSCDYGDSAGDRIGLRLVALDGGDLKAALAPIEAQVRLEVPSGADPSRAGAGADNDRVDIDLPGIHIHANGKDGETGAGESVKIGAGAAGGGNPDAGNGKGGVVIDAHDKGAEIHVDEPGGGVRQTFVLASDKPGPNGFRVAGYEARGPSGGPIVVATVLTKSQEDDDPRDDVRDLLRRNVGG